MPVIVTVDVPVVAVPLAAKVNLLEPVVLLGLNDAVTPAGRPEALSATLPAKPFCGLIVIVSVVLAPWVTLAEAGEALMPKSAAAVPCVTHTGADYSSVPLSCVTLA